MKLTKAGLQNDVVSVYDKTKTFVAGSVAQKTLPAPYDSTTVVGAPFPKFIDVQTDTTPGGVVLAGMMAKTNNGRLFILQATPATGLANFIALYNHDTVTGVYNYVGKIAFAISAATVVPRGFKVDDTDTSNIKIFFAHTSTAVTTGGQLMINKVQLAHFAPSGGVVYYAAQSNDAAAVYSLQLPNEVGGATLLTTAAGICAPKMGGSTDPLINTKIFTHNGISATHQMYGFDYSVAPVLASLGTSTVTSNNTTGVSTTFTMAGNTLAVNDIVVITSNAPTGYVASTGAIAQTLYFVVATNFVSGSTFSLSLTLGGAIVAASAAVGTTTFVRGLGQCTNLGFGKTPNATSLGAGTLLTTNSEGYAVPTELVNVGLACNFMATSTAFHLVKISDFFSTQTGTTNSTINMTGLSDTSTLSIGMTVFGAGIPALTTIASIVSPTAITLSLSATTSTTQTITFGNGIWTSLQTVNVLGNGIDYVLPLPLSAYYSNTFGRVVYLVAGSVVLIKRFLNSQIESSFGGVATNYMEAQHRITETPNLAAITQIENNDGWLFLASSATIGQRGILAFQISADAAFDLHYVISPVINTPFGQTLRSLHTQEQAYDVTGDADLYYRTAATFSDPIFNTASGGWTYWDSGNNDSVVLGNFTQFKALSSLTRIPESGYPVSVPTQLVDILIGTDLVTNISDNWDYSHNDSTSAIPTKIGFGLLTTYTSGTVPRMKLSVRDVDGLLIGTYDTVTHITNFKYSTDSGLNFVALGVIPNVANTRVQFTFTTPPGIDIRIAWEEY